MDRAREKGHAAPARSPCAAGVGRGLKQRTANARSQEALTEVDAPAAVDFKQLPMRLAVRPDNCVHQPSPRLPASDETCQGRCPAASCPRCVLDRRHGTTQTRDADGRGRGIATPFDAQKTTPLARCQGRLRSEADGNRTRNLRIDSPML